jgi:hypothetical protein
MSELQISGKIKQFNDVESGQTKNGGEWQKQTFVVDTGDKYNPDVCFTVFGADKVENLTKYNKVGDVVNVKFNVSSREFNGKWYHNIDAWRIDQDGQTTKPAQAMADESTGDLPF